MYELPEYIILTKRKVHDCYEDDDLNELFAEQKEKLNEIGLHFDDELNFHFFDSPFFDEQIYCGSIFDAITGLAIKDGVDLVRYENGHVGFIAYYNDNTNGFEII